MQWMFARISGLKIFVLSAALLAAPGVVLAQHGGGGGHAGLGGGGGLSGGGRPSGVDAKDDLKDFHHAMAVQATAEQSAAYVSLIASTEAASKMLHELAGRFSQAASADKSPDLAQQANSVDQAVQEARTANKQFLDGFSKSQKSGLKDLTKRLEKADSDLAEQAKSLPAQVAAGTPENKQLTASTENVDKALSSFYDLQLSLGREMGVELPSATQEVALDIPAVSSPVVVGLPIAVTTSGKISKLTTEGGQSSFKLEMVSDLSDLQQNMTTYMHMRLDKSDPCGEHLSIKRATLTPSAPASFVEVQLHYERWTCGRVPGQQIANQLELVQGDGSISIKLTPAVDKSKDGALKLVPEVTHTEGDGSVGEALRTGSLGDDLRENITQAMLSALLKGLDAKKSFPAAAQNHATMQEAKFRVAGAGGLILVLSGDLNISDDQFKLAAGQLKQRVSAEEAAPR